MRLTEQTVSSIVDIWDTIYPGKRSDAELALISGKFFSKFKDSFSDELFRTAAEIVEDEAEFFPTPAHIRKAQPQAQAIINRLAESNRVALPAPRACCPMREAYNKLREDILSQIKKGLSFKDATKCFEIIEDCRVKNTPPDQVPEKYKKHSLW